MVFCPGIKRQRNEMKDSQAHKRDMKGKKRRKALE